MHFSPWKVTRTRTRSIRLSLSSLESRETPTGLLDFPGPQDFSDPNTPGALNPSLPTLPGNPGTPPISLGAPEIKSITAVRDNTTGFVTFTGVVADNGPLAGIQVTIKSTDNSFNVTAVVNADGTFTVTAFTNPFTTYYNAVAIDSTGATSNTYSDFF